MPFVLQCIIYFGAGSLAIGRYWVSSYKFTNHWKPISRLTAAVFMISFLYALAVSQNTDREVTIKLGCLLFGIIVSVCDYLHSLLSEKRD